MALRILSLLCLAALLVRTESSEIPLKLSIDPQSSLLKVSRAERPLLIYNFHSNNFKSYVKELYTSGGNNVVQDSPADHLHHHGLMYAIRINGVNFWEEAKDSGHQKHARFLQQRERVTPDGLPEASFTELIYWVPSQFAKIGDFERNSFLIEERTLTVTLEESSDLLTLQWKGRFEVPREGQNVQIHGSGYNGLGMRFPTGWNHRALHSNSENLPYTKEHTWDLTPAKWARVSAPPTTQPGSVVLFGRPTNPGETIFFSMNNAFAYLSVTQNIEKQPLNYPPGAKFEIDYLLLVSDQAQPEQFVRTRYKKWVAGGSK